jgi:hypothetical protein
MHHSLASQVVRRGIRFARQTQPDADTNKLLQEIARRLLSPASLCVLIATTVLFLAVFTLVEYPIRFVVGNLAIIERTTPTAHETSEGFELDGLLESGDEEEKAGDDIIVDVEDKRSKSNHGVGGQLITKKIRTAMAHLREIGGFKSLYRGFKLCLLYSGLFVTLEILLSGPLYPFSIRQVVVDTISLFTLCTIHCSWTHAIIRAQPSSTNRRKNQHTTLTHTGWTRFIPGFWSRHLILPNIRLLITSTIFSYGTMVTAKFAQQQATSNASHSGNTRIVVVISLALLPTAVGLLALFFMVLPALFALVRVEASLLPESDDAVVPFDRAFGGRIDYSENLPRWSYVYRNLTTFGAWQTIEWEVYRRVVAIYVKFLLIGMVVCLFFALVYAFELYVILGDYASVLAQVMQALMYAN